MQKFALFFSGRRSILGAMGAALLLLSGCDLAVKNLTPPTFSENPSQTYSISVQVIKRSGVIVDDSIQPNIVIDGQIFPMNRSPLGNDIYEFDYRLPSGRQSGAYYFLVNYETKPGSKPGRRDTYTELYKFTVVNRYALTLEVDRAPVGAKVGVLGADSPHQTPSSWAECRPGRISNRPPLSVSTCLPWPRGRIIR